MPRKQLPSIPLEDKVCLYCRNIALCPLLTVDNAFNRAALVTPSHLRECQSWAPIRYTSREIRDKLYERGGESSIRTLYSMPLLLSEEQKLEKQEEEVDAMKEVVDLASMIREGETTVEERRDQLRYITDDNGAPQRDQDGNLMVRPSWEVRNFAISDDYHVKLAQDMGWFWRANQVMDYVIDRELEQGLIVKSRKKSGGSSTKTKTTEAKMAKQVVRRGNRGNDNEKPAKRAREATEEVESSRPRKGAGKPRVEEDDETDEVEARPAKTKAKADGGAVPLEERVKKVKKYSVEVNTNVVALLLDYFAQLSKTSKQCIKVLEDIADDFGLEGAKATESKPVAKADDDDVDYDKEDDDAGADDDDAAGDDDDED
jgi:hypothetical protein